MKVLAKIFIFSAITAVVVGCGKNNTSGKSGNPSGGSQICVSMGANGMCSQYQSVPAYTNINGYNIIPVNNINSPYSYQGISLNAIQAENPCMLTSPMGQSAYARTTISTRVNIGTVVTNGDIYVGVTSQGDVAAIVGNGTNQPTFVAYLCPRPVGGQGTLYPQITIGAYTNCSVKYITAANMVFPDGSQANFRAPSPGGSSVGRKFSFCMQ